MRLLRKTLLAALGLVLVLGILPAAARAEETAADIDYGEAETELPAVLSESEEIIGVAEEWQNKIDKGTVTIRISSEVILDRDFTLPNGVNLYIRPRGTLRIPAGVTLTLAGYFSTLAEGKIFVEPGGELICKSGMYVQEKGSLTVEKGGSLTIRNCEISCGPESTIHIAGNCQIEETSKRACSVFSHYQDGNESSITGISQAYQGICFDIRNQQDLLYAMDSMDSTHYAMYFLEIRGNVTLPSDWTLPENVRVSIMTGDGSLTIPENTRLVINGFICIYAGSLVDNRGTFENNGELWIYGKLSNRAQTNLNAGSHTVVEGTVINDASVYAHEDSTMDVKGTWEGNPATSADSEHVHTFVETVTAPTCTEQGYTTSKCWCGESTVSNYTDPLGHDYDDGTVTTQPGCETAGLMTYTCRNESGHMYTEEIPPLGHQYTETVKAATCTEPGHTISTCENCGDSYLSAYVAELGHDYDEGTFILKPDCETEGLLLHTCRNDNTHTYSELVPATGHSFADNVCTVCGYTLPGGETHTFSLGDVNHDGKINAKDATLILQQSVGVLRDDAPFCEVCAEVSGDGKLNAKDSTLILQYSVGLRKDFPARK